MRGNAKGDPQDLLENPTPLWISAMRVAWNWSPSLKTQTKVSTFSEIQTEQHAAFA